MTRATSPRASNAVGSTHLTALITTWVFALLPANLVPTIIGRLVSDFDVEVTTAGFVATGMTLANAAAVLLLQPIAARGYRRALARVGTLLLVIPLLIGLITKDATVIMIALVVGGVGSGVIIAASSAAVSATRAPDRAANIVMTVNRLVVAVAFFIIPVIGNGLESAMLIMIVPGVFAFIGAQWLPAAPSTSETADQPFAPTPATRYFETLPPARLRACSWLLAVGFGAWSITDDGVFGLVEVFATDHIPGIGDGYVSLLLGFSILCGLLGALLAIPATKLIGRVPTLVIVFALSASTKLGLMLGTNEVLFTVSSCLWGFAFGLMLPIIMGLGAQITRNGSASVLLNGVYILGVALGPTISSQIYSGAGGAALATAMTALGVITAGMMLSVARTADRGARAMESTPAETTEGILR